MPVVKIKSKDELIKYFEDLYNVLLQLLVNPNGAVETLFSDVYLLYIQYRPHFRITNIIKNIEKISNRQIKVTIDETRNKYKFDFAKILRSEFIQYLTLIAKHNNGTVFQVKNPLFVIDKLLPYIQIQISDQIFCSFNNRENDDSYIVLNDDAFKISVEDNKYLYVHLNEKEYMCELLKNNNNIQNILKSKTINFDIRLIFDISKLIEINDKCKIQIIRDAQTLSIYIPNIIELPLNEQTFNTYSDIPRIVEELINNLNEEYYNVFTNMNRKIHLNIVRYQPFRYTIHAADIANFSNIVLDGFNIPYVEGEIVLNI